MLSPEINLRNPDDGAMIRLDTRSVYGFIAEAGHSETLKSLQSPNEVRSLSTFLLSWLAIFAAVAGFLKFPLLLLLPSLLVIGSRQRAFSNLTHDASHGNLFHSTRSNTVISNLLSAYPMLDTVEAYRLKHLHHHRYLGYAQDPDSAKHVEYGYNDWNPPQGQASKTYLRLLFSAHAWKDSLAGGFSSLSKSHKHAILLWWSAVSLIICTAFGWSVLLSFVALWWASRGSSYHAIRLFAEFLDHSGLKPGSIFSFTRTLPKDSVFKHVTHPVADTFHLTHHLLPKVPHYRLNAADALLKEHPAYRDAHHCDGYFYGRHSAMKCWTGKCPVKEPA